MVKTYDVELPSFSGGYDQPPYRWATVVELADYQELERMLERLEAHTGVVIPRGQEIKREQFPLLWEHMEKKDGLS